jgi:hypothetical protein
MTFAAVALLGILALVGTIILPFVGDDGARPPAPLLDLSQPETNNDEVSK